MFAAEAGFNCLTSQINRTCEHLGRNSLTLGLYELLTLIDLLSYSRVSVNLAFKFGCMVYKSIIQYSVEVSDPHMSVLAHALWLFYS